MLQDEAFRMQVRDMLGYDVRDMGHGNAPHAQTGRPQGPQRQFSSTQRTNAASSSAHNEPDLGIMKALSSMGAAAKRNVVQLAQKLRGSGSEGSTNARRESGTTKEFQPLMDTNTNEEVHEDFELINLNSKSDSRSKHILQDSACTTDEDFDHESSSENPLIAHSNPMRTGHTTNNIEIKKYD